MPGRRLNDDERGLDDFWHHPPANLRRPLLRSIEVAPKIDSTGNEVEPRIGLRGIERCIVPFRYPITAICGNNGVGKSTFLALAALAHHSPAGWFVHLGNTSPHLSRGDRTYYTFSDFFVQGRGDVSPINIEVTWRYYHHGQEISLTFTKTDRWGRYARRPEREVDFLGLGRLLPAYEVTVIRSTFRDPPTRVRIDLLLDEFCQSLSFIMGKEYTQAEVQQSGRYTFQRCHAGTVYTAFNMGGGESSVIALLYLLQRMPPGGLLVVEEIEASLHPQAQTRLAQELVRICRRKQLQLICSTHSGIFLDALPRQARLLVKRSDSENFVLESPSTRFAMYEMTGQCQPELMIYCEDRSAAVLIEEALPHGTRRRVMIQEVGNDRTVIRQGVSHIRSGFRMRSLCAIDGDCTPNEVERWIGAERGAREDIQPEYLLLPGDGLAPERWVIEQLGHADYRDEFAAQLGCLMQEAQAHVQAMLVELDHHHIGFCLHLRTGREPDDCLRRIMRAVAPRHPQLDELRSAVADLLD